MKNLIKISSILLILFSTSCTTPYQKQTWYAYRGGYSEKKLEDNRFLVTFNGNGWTDSRKISDFALRRSAEVTLENGFKYFKIEKNSNEKIRQPAYGTGLAGIMAGQLIPKPSTSHVIICYKKGPYVSEEIYDAQQVVEQIKNEY